MRIREVAGGIYLVRPDLAEELRHEADILFGQWFLPDLAGFVKREFEEMGSFSRDADIPASSQRFTPSDGCLDPLNGFCIHLSRFLGMNESGYLFMDGSGIERFQFEDIPVLIHKVEITKHIVIKHSDAA